MIIPNSSIIEVEDAKILIWEMNQTADQLVEMWKRYGFDLNSYNELSSEKRKREFLSVRFALSSLLEKEISIRYNDEGKPFLDDESHQISISHSKHQIAVIAHPNRKVGIDIESNTDKIQKIYKRFLSEAEQSELSEGKDLKQLQIAWSAKEALYKIIGKEAVDFANQLRIFSFEAQKEGKINALHVPTNKGYNLSYIQTADYTLVYCLDNKKK